MNDRTILPLDENRREVSNHGNGGHGDFDDRLRNLEIEFGNAQKDIGHIKETMATKTDIANLKVWILGGVLSAIVIAATIAAMVVKVFF